MDLKSIQLQVEAIIFASESGASISEILEVLTNTGEPDPTTEPEYPVATTTKRLGWNEGMISEILTAIEEKYQQEDYVIELRKINHGFQFLTKSKFHDTINRLQSHRSRKKLSQSAMETLAIIAYRQPITKLEIEHIRGVNCDYSVQRLLEKELITIVGKAETVGRPLLYGPSPFLMDYFGLNDPSEFPKMKDIESEENTIGISTG